MQFKKSIFFSFLFCFLKKEKKEKRFLFVRRNHIVFLFFLSLSIIRYLLCNFYKFLKILHVSGAQAKINKKFAVGDDRSF